MSMPLGVEGPHVDGHRRRREVGGPGPGGAEELDVDPVRNQLDRAVVRPGCGPGRASRPPPHRCRRRRRSLVGLAAGPLAGRQRGQQPVVGDVVDGRPAGGHGESGVGGVVDPQQRLGAVRVRDGLGHLAPERPVGGRARAIRGSHLRGRSTWIRGWTCSSDGPARSWAGPAELEGDVHRGGDVEHLRGGVRAPTNSSTRIRIRAADLVPWLEGAHHERRGGPRSRGWLAGPRCCRRGSVLPCVFLGCCRVDPFDPAPMRGGPANEFVLSVVTCRADLEVGFGRRQPGDTRLRPGNDAGVHDRGRYDGSADLRDAPRHPEAP